MPTASTIPVLLPTPPAISGPSHPNPFSVVPNLPPDHEPAEWDSLTQIRESLIAKEQQLALFAARAEAESREAHDRAISLARQYRLAKAARLALSGY